MIRVKTIPLSEARVGMKVAHNVYSGLGSLLLNKDTVLDFRKIKSLRTQGVKTVDVYVEEDQVQIVNLRDIGYLPLMEEVRVFLNKIRDTEQIDFRLLANIVDGIKEIRDTREIVLWLTESFQPHLYIYYHSLNVALLAKLIGHWMKFSDKKITQLIYAGILHDIGKFKVSPNILNKPGDLTDEEFEEVKKHSTYGYQMVHNLKFLSDNIKRGILDHHERRDGSGYPNQCVSGEISEIAEVIAIADIYDAMTSKRVYSEKQSPFCVFKVMEDESYNKLNVSITRTLLNNIANYYKGHRVILNNGAKGEIVFINPNRIARPLIKDADGEFIDLSMETSLKITQMASGISFVEE